jgi:hypothetical protein
MKTLQMRLQTSVRGAIDRDETAGHDAKDQQQKHPIDIHEHATIDHRWK